MPIKVKLVDNSSEVGVGVGSGAAVSLFKEALKKETKERIAADNHLQEEIDTLIAGKAAYLLITENENGSIDISLLNEKEEVLDTKTITLTEKLIKNIELDYINSQLIFTHFDGTTITCSVDAIKQAIINEVARAEAAEEELRVNLAAEVARAIEIETGLRTDLGAEISRATNAESILNDKIEAETTRAEHAEDILTTNLNQEIYDRTAAIENETNRATQAEGTLNTKIENEITRAIATDEALDTKIEAEIARAEAAEASFIGQVEAEEEARIAADEVLQDNIDTEASVRDAADDTLQTNIDEEEVARIAADEILQNNINTLDAAAVHKAGEETITGAKTFDNDVKVALKTETRTYSIKFNGQSSTPEIYVDGYDAHINVPTIFGGTLSPDNATSDLGKSGNKWRDEYLSGKLYIGTTNSNWKLYEGDNGYLRIGADVDRYQWGYYTYSPLRDNEIDLGLADKRWKDAYFSGTANIGKVSIKENANGLSGVLSFNNSTSAYLSPGAISSLNIYPIADDTYSLGISNSKYKDLYLSDAIYGNQGRKDIDLSGGGIALGSELYTALVRPRTNNASDLGTTDFKYKDLYLSGNIGNNNNRANIIYGSTGNFTYLDGGLNTKSSIKVYNVGHFNIDLGTADRPFRNLVIWNKILKDTNGTYGFALPDTTNWTEDHTIATTDNITTAINALDVDSVGEDGYYLKTIIEADGLITATKEQFDRQIDNSSSHNNTPSSQAVKEFVNSSISTNTANFLGTFNIVDDLGLTTSATHAQVSAALATEISGATNNDYCFVWIPDSVDPTQAIEYDRYKWVDTGEVGQTPAWDFEYALNNSSFTQAQWAAINSGIDSDKVSRIVYTDTDQTVSGVKKFTDTDAFEAGLIVGKAGVDGQKLQIIGKYGTNQIYTGTSNQLFFANLSQWDKAAYLDTSNFNIRSRNFRLTGKVNPNNSNFGLLFPSTSEFTEDKTLVTEDRVNELASNKADKVIGESGEVVDGMLAGLDSNGNLTNSDISINNVPLLDGNNTWTGTNTFANNVLPDSDMTRNLGSSSYKWSTGYFNHIFSTYFDARNSYFSGNVRPNGGSRDLGGSSYIWRDLYLSRNITDGTNSTTIANINNNFAPKYDYTATYAIGDIVIYEGRLYKCTTAITTAEAWDSTHWLAINLTDSSNGFVTLDTTQIIAGSKTFTNTIGSNVANGSNVLSTNTNWTINKDSNGKINIGQPNNDIRFYDSDIRFNTTLIRPQVTDTTNLGNSDYKFKELYLSGSAFIGQSLRLTYSGSYQISKRGDDGITIANTANNKGIRIMGQGVDALVPNVANYSLGTSTDTWKDEWLSGKQYFAYNTDSYTPTERNWNIYHNQYNELVFARTYNSVDQEKIKFNGGSIYTEDANGNLGSSSKKWKDLYLSGNLTDGTNSIAVANIQEKVTVRRFI